MHFHFDAGEIVCEHTLRVNADGHVLFRSSAFNQEY
jgi:hypothetical protein